MVNKRKMGASDISIEAMTSGLINAVRKDWAHRDIEGAPQPQVDMHSWVHSRISALYRELERNSIRVKGFSPIKDMPRELFVDMVRGALPLVGILKYDARNWHHFDGKIVFQVAVPTRNFKMEPWSKEVYRCNEAGDVCTLEYIGAKDAALYATFARERMKVTNRIAIALVQSIGKV